MEKDASLKKRVTRVPKKTVTKSVAPKKTKRKVEREPIKTEVRKAKVNQDVVKTVSVASRKVTSKANIKQKKLTRVSEETDTVVLIGGTLSQRLEERRKIYEYWYKNYVPKVASPVAKITGYSFVLVGVLGVYFSWSNLNPQSLLSQTALLGCLTTNCSQEVSSVSSNLEGESPVKVVFVENPIFVPGEDTPLALKIHNAASFQLYLVSLSSNERRMVEPSSLSEGITHYRLPTKELTPSEYTVVLETKDAANVTSIIMGPVISIEQTEPEQVGEAPQEVISRTEISVNAPTSTDLVLDVDTVANEDLPLNGEISSAELAHASKTPAFASTSEVSPEVIDPESASIVTTEVTPIEPVIKSSATPISPDSGMTLTITPGLSQTDFRIDISPTYRYDSLELSVVKSNSSEQRFLGLARPTSDGWSYWLDAKHLPTGSYFITARGKVDGEFKEEVTAAFANTVPYEVPKSTLEVTDQSAEVGAIFSELYVWDSPTQLQIENNSDLDSESTAAAQDTSIVTDSVSEILSINDSLLQSLFLRHASALVTNSEFLQRVVDAEFNLAVKEMFETLPEDADFSTDEAVVFALTKEIERRKEQAIKLYSELKNRVGERQVVDTDRDGISDFDEIRLYGTSPEFADTDSDGIIDGIEIMQGVNPNEVSSSGVLTFSSPKETSYVHDNLVSITKVKPLLHYGTSESLPTVHTEISGVGLPNSLVSLYIFSDPIVTTVRTNADGSFVYVLEKELPDGGHEVYAALTDSRGTIAARSTAFRFTKFGQLFTSINLEAGVAYATTDKNALYAAYNLIGAIGIVSFGLILLMLGNNIVTHRPDEIAVFAAELPKPNSLKNT